MRELFLTGHVSGVHLSPCGHPCYTVCTW